MWTRDQFADVDHEFGRYHKPNRRGSLAPGRRTLTQSLPSVQRRAASDALPAATREGDAGTSSPIPQRNNRIAFPADAASDPFDFRFRAPADAGVAIQRKATGGSACACGTCESCKAGTTATEAIDTEARPVHRSAAGGHGTGDADAAVAQGLGSSGQVLDGETRTFMESRFGHDFSDVRVHVDGAAGESARALHADAYTVGREVVFAPGMYDPGNASGQRLLAHELTHVVQQGGGRPGAQVAQRQAADGAATPAAAGRTDGRAATGDSTAKLQHLIASIEQVHARAAVVTGEPHSDMASDVGEAGSSGDAADVNQHRSRVGQMLAQLREVVAGGDEATKQRVVRAFSPAGARQAESILEAQVKVEQRRPEGMAARSVEVSHPSDPAEIEAEHVADAVMAGGGVTVQQRASGPHRQVADAMTAGDLTIPEAMVAGGVATLEADATVAPETGPPGWVIGGLVALGALAVIGVGYILMSAPGNVADTGIVNEAQALIAAGAAATMCEALQILMDQARDAARKQRIKRTQKAKGCRHSRHS